MMEAPLEDEPPAGVMVGVDSRDHAEELKACDEATAFMSSIGELSVSVHSVG